MDAMLDVGAGWGTAQVELSLCVASKAGEVDLSEVWVHCFMCSGLDVSAGLQAGRNAWCRNPSEHQILSCLLSLSLPCLSCRAMCATY